MLNEVDYSLPRLSERGVANESAVFTAKNLIFNPNLTYAGLLVTRKMTISPDMNSLGKKNVHGVLKTSPQTKCIALQTSKRAVEEVCSFRQ